MIHLSFLMYTIDSASLHKLRDRCLEEGLAIFSETPDAFYSQFSHHLQVLTKINPPVIPKKHIDCWTYCTWSTPRPLHQSLDDFDRFSHPGAVQDLIYQYFTIDEQIELEDKLDALALFTYAFCLTLVDFKDRQRQALLHRFLYGVLRTYHSSSWR
jgi:hypothetical protein